MKRVELPPGWRERAIVVADASLDERNAWLTEEELSECQRFSRLSRRAEWLATRAAAKELAVTRGLCADPKECRVARPYLILGGRESQWFVSLSHSRGYAAAAVDARPVGVDIEVVRDIRESAARLFLDAREEAEMLRCHLPYRLIHFWAAKEAAWKSELGAIATLRRVPLRLVDEREDGLTFDRAQTVMCGEVVVGLTRMCLDFA